MKRQKVPVLSAEKVNRFIQVLSLSICLFIYLDAYILSSKRSREVVTDKASYEGKLRSGRFYYSMIITSTCSLKLSALAYEKVNIGDTIIVKRSRIINFVQGLEVEKEERTFFPHIGFQSNQGIVYLTVVTLGIVTFIAAYRKVKYLQARRDVGIYLLILSLLLLFLHIWF